MVNTLNNKIMMWNCRGGANRFFIRVFQNYFQQVHMNILVILETRMEPSKLDKTFKLLGFDILIGYEVRGYSGGITMGWKSHKVKIEVLKIHF